MRRFFAACTTVLMFALLVPAVAHAAEHTASSTIFVTNPKDGQKIAITVFKPAAATVDPALDVPVILQSHGWNGSRAKTISGEVKAMLDAGFGVVSIDQRGHGESAAQYSVTDDNLGRAHVQDPTRETEDVKAVIDYVAALDWVAHDTDATGAPIPNDPLLGAIGGSYGGGYQTMTTLDEIADQGRTRLDALAPEITWYDLPESLAPQKVARSAWTALLYAAGADMLPYYVHQAQVWGTSTGQWPDGTVFGQPAPGVPNLDAEFHKHGPVYFAERGIKIDVPVLVRQGASDNLFNLNQGLDIFHKALTPEALEESYFLSFNGGHALPNAAPPGVGTAGDGCVPDWSALRVEFFRRAFAGVSTDGLLTHRYNLTDVDGKTCIRGDVLDASRSVKVGRSVTTTGAGVPQHVEVAQGPITVTGVPKLAGKVTALGLDSRAFFGLSMGTSPADAKVIQNNLMPLREVLPSVDKGFDIELPGVAVNVPAGQKLFLTITPVSDMYFAHGSRTPGGLVLSDMMLTLPRAEILPEPEPEPEQRASAMTLVVDGNGSKSRLVATLTDAASGAGLSGATVRFIADGTALGTAVTDGAGVAALELDGRYRGNRHAFESIFDGNADYTASRASTTT